jgi:hypothetical protein
MPAGNEAVPAAKRRAKAAMNQRDPNGRVREPTDSGFDAGFDGHRRRQATMGLRLTPAERLRWLEQTMEELRRIGGRAAGGRRP